MQDGHRAVFLSYASEDAGAAARICASLRGAGIEVWFDQSELRGGDAWDNTIRKQIKGCALFMPIISASSQLRAEGYFRLEWKLAVDRSHLMAADKPFLMPIVIDGTRDTDARVPDRFRDVQWTRLPGGDAPPAFAERVARLLAPAEQAHQAHESPAAGAVPAAATPAAATGVVAPAAPPRPRPPRRLGTAVLLLGAVIVVGGALGWAAKRHLHAASVVPYSIEDRRMTFAVLPFVAPADDARAMQVAKTTGEVINAELESDAIWAHAAPRRTVEEAVAHLTGVKDLAKALDVHFLVRGTVAKAVSGYTVNLLVIDGSSERVLGARQLAIPADALVPRWHDDLGEALWQLLLPALEVEVKHAADLPVETLDVRDLSFRAFVNWRAHRGKEAKAGYLSATELLNRALALAPDDPLATYLTAEINLCDCVMAWSENVEEQKAIGAAALEKYLRIDPNNAEMLSDKALLFQLRGRYDESLVISDSILQRDPEYADALGIKATGLLRLGRPREALPIAEALMARYPDRWPGVTALAADVHYALGDYALAAQLARNAAARMSDGELRSPVDGPIRLTLAAAEAELGHRDRARAALADFNAAVPQVTTIAAVKKWMHATADLAEFAPLLDGLRLAGVKD